MISPIIRCNTCCITQFSNSVIQFVIQSVTHITENVDIYDMSPMITARISEGMKSEIEVLVADIGLWETKSEFIIDALDKQIKNYWRGSRFDQRSNRF